MTDHRTTIAAAARAWADCRSQENAEALQRAIDDALQAGQELAAELASERDKRAEWQALAADECSRAEAARRSAGEAAKVSPAVGRSMLSTFKEAGYFGLCLRLQELHDAEAVRSWAYAQGATTKPAGEPS